jgi:hypothetical protein
MINQQLLDFIKQQLSKGISKDKITSDLLSNGWNIEDVAEGFAAITLKVSPTPPTPRAPITPQPVQPAPVTPTTPPAAISPLIQNISSTMNNSMIYPKESFIPPSYDNSVNITETAPIQIQKKSHSGRNMFVTILILFLLAGGVSAYYFKDNLVNLPIVKNILAKKELALETPIASTNQVQNIPVPIQNVAVTPVQPVQQPAQPVPPSVTPPASPVLKTQVSSGVLDCGTDANCFLQEINECSLAKASVKVKQPILYDFVTFNYQLSLNGEKSGNCLFKMSQKSALVELNQAAIQLSEKQSQALVSEGKLTEQQYNDGLKQLQDTSEDQAFWNKQNNNIWNCTVSSVTLKPLLTKLLIAKPWSADNMEISGGTDEGLTKYCKISAPSTKQ